MKIHKTILVLLFFATLSMVTSCSRDPGCGDLSDKNIYYNIADSDKAKIPYNSNDTIVFVSNINDTAVLIAQGKLTNFKKTSNSIGTADCPKYEIGNFETISILMNEKKSRPDFFNLRYSIYRDIEIEPFSTRISFTLNNKAISSGNSSKIINMQNFYIDTLNANNKLYYGINIHGDGLDSLYQIFFNYNYGILRIIFPSNQTWIAYEK